MDICVSTTPGSSTTPVQDKINYVSFGSTEKKNLADYFSKDHATKYYQEMRPKYVIMNYNMITTIMLGKPGKCMSSKSIPPNHVKFT